MSKAPLTTLTLCSLQQWAHAQMNRALAIMEQNLFDDANAVFASAAAPRTLCSWGAGVELLTERLGLRPEERFLRS